MHFLTTLAALASVPAVAYAATHSVQVGANNMLQFDPSNIQANVGDSVEFMFMSKNHSVTQSTFTSPCTKAMFNGTAGVNSGFLATPQGSNATNGSMPTWSIQVTNTTPLWFYCAQKNPVPHCEMGMVFSINATPEKSFDMFQSMAKSSGNSTASTDSAGSSNSTADTSGAAGASSNSTSGAANAGSGGSSSGSGSPTSAADNSQQSTKPNGAARTVFSRGAAALLTVTAIGAVLL